MAGSLPAVTSLPLVAKLFLQSSTCLVTRVSVCFIWDVSLFGWHLVFQSSICVHALYSLLIDLRCRVKKIVAPVPASVPECQTLGVSW